MSFYMRTFSLGTLGNHLNDEKCPFGSIPQKIGMIPKQLINQQNMPLYANSLNAIWTNIWPKITCR